MTRTVRAEVERSEGEALGEMALVWGKQQALGETSS
jgi:hypothetical protein